LHINQFLKVNIRGEYLYNTLPLTFAVGKVWNISCKYLYINIFLPENSKNMEDLLINLRFASLKMVFNEAGTSPKQAAEVFKQEGNTINKTAKDSKQEDPRPIAPTDNDGADNTPTAGGVTNVLAAGGFNLRQGYLRKLESPLDRCRYSIAVCQ
jgi:hypothetical protein